MSISIYTTTYNLKLNNNQLYGLRGAMIDYAGKNLDHFHNRKIENGEWKETLNRYPHIQYRTHDDMLQIWALNEGIPQLKSLIKEDKIPNFRLEGQRMHLRIKREKEQLNYQPIFLGRKKQQYRIHSYIPFNKEKLASYQNAKKLSERIKLVEQLILNELVLFTYAINWKLKTSEKIKVELFDFERISKASYQTKNKKNKPEKFWYKTFTLVFSTNVDLPSGISLGRHKSMGYGVLEKII